MNLAWQRRPWQRVPYWLVILWAVYLIVFTGSIYILGRQYAIINRAVTYTSGSIL